MSHSGVAAPKPACRSQRLAIDDSVGARSPKVTVCANGLPLASDAECVGHRRLTCMQVRTVGLATPRLPLEVGS